MKVNKIIFENFKFFHGKEELNLNEKNLLLYGENGSGKSSIYWGLYTLLQSSQKENEDIKKYFDDGDSSNLVNRFMKEDSKSSISLEIVDSSKGSQLYQIGIDKFQTNNSTMKEANQASDFINYRLLARLYDFRNSEDIDLFPLFEKEILQYITFDHETKDALALWKNYKDGMNPRPHMNTDEYRFFTNRIWSFNVKLKELLNKIAESANKYLQNEFKETLKIIFTYSDATYDDFIPGGKSRNRKTKAPKIKLSVESLNSELEEEKRHIDRPHTFLNEAKLTSIALSIRFAILDEKLESEDVCKILILDDLLVSLDMSHRDTVLNIILENFKKYQLLIMTHDKQFFNMMHNKIKSKEIKKDDETVKIIDSWLVKEMYYDDRGKIPKPFILDTENYFELAKKHLLEFDYPACANYLRKECERLLKEILPTNLSRKKDISLDSLIQLFNNYYEDCGGNKKDFEKLKEYKDLLLNPLSHDNIDTPIYKIEVESIFKLIENLKKVDVKILYNLSDEKSQYVYILKKDNKDVEYRFKILLKEVFKAIKTLNNCWCSNNPKSLIIEKESSSGIESLKTKEVKLLQNYNYIRKSLGLDDTTRKHSLLRIIKNKDNISMRKLLIKQKEK